MQNNADWAVCAAQSRIVLGDSLEDVILLWITKCPAFCNYTVYPFTWPPSIHKPQLTCKNLGNPRKKLLNNTKNQPEIPTHTLAIIHPTLLCAETTLERATHPTPYTAVCCSDPKTCHAPYTHTTLWAYMVIPATLACSMHFYTPFNRGVLLWSQWSWHPPWTTHRTPRGFVS